MKNHFISHFVILLLLGFYTTSAHSSTPGLPFTEDFSAKNLKDTGLTTANWDTTEKQLVLEAWQKQLSRLQGVIGQDLSNDTNNSRSIIIGDLDGDGDLDIVSGNEGQINRIYLNDGLGVFTGQNLSTDTNDTTSLILGDVDNDGDLHVVAGNFNQINRLYLNDGSAGFTGQDLSADANNTTSVGIGDVDLDGDLDILTGNLGEVNRVYTVMVRLPARTSAQIRTIPEQLYLAIWIETETWILSQATLVR